MHRALVVSVAASVTSYGASSAKEVHSGAKPKTIAMDCKTGLKGERAFNIYLKDA